jgi:hypothetical protein
MLAGRSTDAAASEAWSSSPTELSHAITDCALAWSSSA